MKSLYLDCFSGASGDMLVGALLDAGASLDRLREALNKLEVPGYTIAAERVVRQGISATQFHCHVDHHAHHAHRHLHHILAIIERAGLPEAVQSGATETFRRIAETEAKVHGTSIDHVHFHEVGAIDSIVDVIGAHVALHDLGIEHVTASPLPLGRGTIQCDHGVLPVPAPATALLVQGVPTYGGDVEAELVTPTGAALVTQWARAYGPMPVMKISAIGYGSGTREIPGRPNVLRAFIGAVDPASASHERIAIAETNVDDMPGELLPPLIQSLIEAGARDAFLTPILAKKGRPGYLLTVLCDEDKLGALLPVIFRGTSTLGVRIRTERRICLQREWKEVATPWGPVRVKLGRWEGGLTVAAPEFEECRRLAESAGQSVKCVYDAAAAAAHQLKQEMDHA